MKIAVLTGAGISQESGIKTFRDSNGLWENHDVMEVASPQGFKNNPELVLRFYNDRRKQLKEVRPNLAHQFLADLENEHEVNIITQNVDDLHERSGSTNIIHLHGELKKSRSVNNNSKVFECTEDINVGDLAEDGGQLRPHIVWFGEAVPMMDKAIKVVQQADILIIIGTSMQVYPAASLINYTKDNTPIYIIDPSPLNVVNSSIIHIQEKAVKGITELKDLLKEHLD